MKNNTLDTVSTIALVLGGLNWGVLGLLGHNVIDEIFGNELGNVLFMAVGLAAIYKIGIWIKSRSK